MGGQATATRYNPLPCLAPRNPRWEDTLDHLGMGQAVRRLHMSGYGGALTRASPSDAKRTPPPRNSRHGHACKPHRQSPALCSPMQHTHTCACTRTHIYAHTQEQTLAA